MPSLCPSLKASYFFDKVLVASLKDKHRFTPSSFYLPGVGKTSAHEAPAPADPFQKALPSPRASWGWGERRCLATEEWRSGSSKLGTGRFWFPVTLGKGPCGWPVATLLCLSSSKTPVHFPDWKDHTCPSPQILKKKRDFSWRSADHNFQMLGCLFTHLYIHFSYGSCGNTV